MARVLIDLSTGERGVFVEDACEVLVRSILITYMYILAIV